MVGVQTSSELQREHVEDQARAAPLPLPGAHDSPRRVGRTSAPRQPRQARHATREIPPALVPLVRLLPWSSVVVRVFPHGPSTAAWARNPGFDICAIQRELLLRDLHPRQSAAHHLPPRRRLCRACPVRLRFLVQPRDRDIDLGLHRRHCSRGRLHLVVYVYGDALDVPHGDQGHGGADHGRGVFDFQQLWRLRRSYGWSLACCVLQPGRREGPGRH
mmetsp:Transcript_63003/g.148420  ORF Transcript_63003/g.148420 Transcript_63003/m.148420 type:complete len:217 (+) Transcript_63003:650-1300(+)